MSVGNKSKGPRPLRGSQDQYEDFSPKNFSPLFQAFSRDPSLGPHPFFEGGGTDHPKDENSQLYRKSAGKGKPLTKIRNPQREQASC